MADTAKVDPQKIEQEATWLGARLKEPSTYAGLGVLLTLAFHVSNAGLLATNIQTVGVGLGSVILGVIAIVAPEKGATK
jgi:anaerobic glycerol-3-phosphate dehydrogenase